MVGHVLQKRWPISGLPALHGFRKTEKHCRQRLAKLALSQLTNGIPVAILKRACGLCRESCQVDHQCFIIGLPLRSTFSNTLPTGGRMSLKFARMANHSASIPLAKLSCIAGIGFALVGQPAVCQENALKITFPQSTNAPKSAGGGQRPETATEFNQREKVLSPSEEGRTRDDRTSELEPAVKPAQETKREPLKVPSLTIPNTSLKSNTGATPDDLVVGRLPTPISLPYGQDRFGYWTLDTKTWTAPVYCQQPTYFDDVMLEEHGHERFPKLQPLVSGVKFYSTAAFLPYLSCLNPPLQNYYSTGHYRPGTAAPCLRQRAPYDKGALRYQLLTTGATILVAQP